MTKNIIILVLILVVAGLFIKSMLNKNDNEQVNNSPTPTASPVAQESPGQVVTTPNGLKIQDTVIGSGDLAERGRYITVHYTGTLENGTKFDSSVDRGQPFSFVLGAGEVIQGWEQGFEGMRVGGKRKLIIPAALAYGSRGAGNIIPPNATLYFDVELLSVVNAK